MKNQVAFEIEGLRPLSNSELTHTFGGGWWSDFKEGFKEGWNWAKGAISEIAIIVGVIAKLR